MYSSLLVWLPVPAMWPYHHSRSECCYFLFNANSTQRTRLSNSAQLAPTEDRSGTVLPMIAPSPVPQDLSLLFLLTLLSPFPCSRVDYARFVIVLDHDLHDGLWTIVSFSSCFSISIESNITKRVGELLEAAWNTYSTTSQSLSLLKSCFYQDRRPLGVSWCRGIVSSKTALDGRI